jgi:UDP-N-acetylglucosamine--N-acetylmuramyl-(pentapeptide) pyrophosphoryl-undecaprenol N-acetylglucosamine transferase
MAPLAKKITTALVKQTEFFPSRKVLWLGNPIRDEIISQKNKGYSFFKFDDKKPIVLATGGGTGSLRVNELIVEAVQHLRGACQIIHLSGKERPQGIVTHAEKLFSDFYHVYQFLNKEMPAAYQCASLVICRGGFGTLSELAALHKPAIVIPKPGHQDENVAFLAHHNAVIVLNEKQTDGLQLAKTVKELLANTSQMKTLADNLANLLPPADPAQIYNLVSEIIAE